MTHLAKDPSSAFNRIPRPMSLRNKSCADAVLHHVRTHCALKESSGMLNLGGEIKRTYERIPSLEEYCSGTISAEKVAQYRQESIARGSSLSDVIMDKFGWPQIPLDGQLLVSQQDALLMGGKVQAAPGFADHVLQRDASLCTTCSPQLCVEICSGQALTCSEGGGAPQFDREKCVHCGACLWNCTKPLTAGDEQANIDFRAGSGGFHSAEN